MVCSHLVNVFFSVPIRKEGQKQFILTWDAQQYSFTVPPRGCVSCLAFRLDVISRDRAHVDIPRNITLVRSISDPVLIRLDE